MTDKELTKICPKCNVEKILDVNNFQWRTDNNKWRNECKECRIKYHANYYIDNKEELDARNKQYEIDHKEEMKAYRKGYWKNINDEKRIQRQLQDTRTEEQKLEEKERAERQRKDNRNAYEKEKRDTDPVYKARITISNRIRSAIKNNGGSKAGEATFENLPYTVEEFVAHIESHFILSENLDANGKVQMTWENWGNYHANIFTWHLDHKIPQSDLPYKTMQDENFKKCWSLENLRPLSAKQNITEGSRRTRHQKKESK